MRLLAPRLDIYTALVLVTLAATSGAEPLGSGFTYQGQLKQQGAPFDGNVDLRIAIFDVEANGTPLDELDVTNVSVTKGLFTIALDFGAEVFNGDELWLEIAVRSPHDPTDTEPFTILTPRQLITATPYALQTRGLFVDNDGDVVIGAVSTNFDYDLTVIGDGDTAVRAVTRGTYGVYGKSSSFDGRGVYGVAAGKGGDAVGVMGISNSVTGRGVYGVTTEPLGSNYGVYGETASPGGYAGYFKGGRNYFEGKVGIGTESPDYTLTVVSGSSRAISATSSSSRGVFGESTSNFGSGIYGQATGEGGRGVYGYATRETETNYGVYGRTSSPSGYAGYFRGGRNYFEGNVGLGTDSPQERLHLGGTDANLLLREGGGNPYIEIGDSTVQRGYLQWLSSSNRVALYTSAHDYAIAIGRTDLGGIFVQTETHNCDVGIGTESPQYKLHVAGDAGKPGGGSWSNSSDRRLKKNIRDLSGSLERLMRLRGVSFEYKNPDAINELPGESIGMIAQEVELAFPDWVNKGGHGYKTVTFRGFEALAVEALRELRKEKDRELAVKGDEIRDLRAANADLMLRMARLEALVATLAGVKEADE